MVNAKNIQDSCLRIDSTECEGKTGAQNAVYPEQGGTESRKPKLLEAILRALRLARERRGCSIGYIRNPC